MSLLAPLFLLGLTALSLPLIFHLIRRTPRGEMLFSSLMFLQPSPPRITKRSRLDNLLLLLLRALALACLAFAFSRPFFRQAGGSAESDGVSQRVAVLIDASASMRRGDLWPRAVEALDNALAEFRPQDQYAVYAFDDTLRPVASFDDLAAVDPRQRRQTVATLMKEVEPTWAATRLGQALAEAVSSLRGAGEDGAAAARKRILVISDMQSGSRLDELGAYEWPKNISLELAPLDPADPTNAGLELLGLKAKAQTLEDARDQRVRVRVTNAAGSTADSFKVQWLGADGQPIGDAADVYVPAGESRVARIDAPPAPAPGAGEAPPLTLTLTGDAHDFDNSAAYLPERQQSVRVAYVGTDDPDDPKGLAFYLKRALESDGARSAEIAKTPVGDQPIFTDQPPLLAVVGAPPSGSQAAELRRYAERGGLVLYVVTSKDDAAPLGALLDADDVEVTELNPRDYAMLTQIDFDHPMFTAMAGPQFNNFTQILFWKHRRVEGSPLDDASVLARFDSGEPAIWQSTIGSGDVVVMASGWNPVDSQLALSWKFPLMLSSLTESRRDAGFSTAYRVNEPAPLPEGVKLAEEPRLVKPDGSEVALSADTTQITDTDLPGVYSVAAADGATRFVVRLDPLESDTQPLAPEAFEQAGAQLANSFDAAAEEENLQRLRDVELEGRQQIWKWLVVVALVLLVVETLLAGWTSRRNQTSHGDLGHAAA